MATVVLMLLGAGLATSAFGAPRAPEHLYRAMLKDYRRYTETLWHPMAGRPDMGFWGTGKSGGGNEGIRAVTNTALVYATLHADGDRAFAVSRRLDPALRYAAHTYAGGPALATDGKQWGNSWQSAMWAGNLGIAAFIVRDELSPETLAAVKKAVAAEANRFIGKMPPQMTPGDTKSEEIAWDLMSPAAALILMPDHANAAIWREALLRYGFNVLSVEADKASTEVKDGRPLGEWVTTAQLYPDYTLENHGFFHPVYAMVGAATLGHAAVALKLAGHDIPDALKHNVLPEWETLKYIALPDGEWVYPQGLDWDLHDYEHIPYWAMLATLYNDPAAAVLEERTAEYGRRRQIINGDGRFVGPTSNLGFAREAVQAERVAYSLWMHKLFTDGAARPPREADLNAVFARLAPVRAFDRAGFVVQRTPRGLNAFSWRNRVMGLVTPASQEHLDQPYVTTPYLEGITGRFRLKGEAAATRNLVTVRRKAIAPSSHGFLVALDTDLHGGKIRQQMAVASFASGAMAYVDYVTAREPLVVTEERGLPMGIENDDVTHGRRTLYAAEGIHTMVAGQARDHPVPGTWANVDNRLGLVSPGGPLMWRAAGPANRPGAREDILYGAYRSQSRPYTAGDVVAQRAAIFLPGATAQETARVAAAAVVSRTISGTAVRFPDLSGQVHTLFISRDGLVSLDGATTTPSA